MYIFFYRMHKSYREAWHLRIAARLFPREDIMDVIADLVPSDIVVVVGIIDSSSSLLDAMSCKCAHADLTRSRLAIDGGKEEDFSNSAALTLFFSCLESRAEFLQSESNRL